MGALMGAGKRLLTGESLFMTVFLNRGTAQEARRVRRALSRQDHRRFTSPRSAASSSRRRTRFSPRRRACRIGIAFQKKLGVGLFGGEGFIMQRLQGDGWAFVHAGGTLQERTLAPGEADSRRHRLHRRVPAVGQLRHPVRRQDQVGALRRRRTVLRDAARPRQDLAAVAAAQPAGEPHRRRRARPRRGGAKKARSSAGSAGCSTATTASCRIGWAGAPRRIRRPG